MASRRRPKKYSPEKLLEQLASSDPETRWRAARDLDTHGDRSAIVPLEETALGDSDQFTREGAYVDTVEAPYAAAIAALESVYLRHPPSADDVARVRAWLAKPELAAERREAVATTLGAAAAECAEPLLRHPDATVRLIATNVIARARRMRANEALWADDASVRLAATLQDAYRAQLVSDALQRFPDEPSSRVRRGIYDLWLRYRARMGGPLQPHELSCLLVDPDPAIHAPVAQQVLDTARSSNSPWTYDPVGFRSIRAQLASLVTRDGAAPVLREVLALIDTTLTPFAEPAIAESIAQPAVKATRSSAPTTPVARPTPVTAAVEPWSVLNESPVALSERARTALLAISAERRAALSRRIGTAVLNEVERMVAPWFSPNGSDHAEVDVFHATARGDALVLHFVADHDNYNLAQSGSDWDDHYVFAGEAEVVGADVAKLAFALARHTHLTEHEHEGYSARETRDRVRDELRRGQALLS